MKYSIIIITILMLGIYSMVRSQDNETIITAHRGASGHSPENTIAALKQAVDMKAEFSEIDVQETLDGEIILLHDKTLEKTTGVDKNIWETNYEDLKDLDAGIWFGEDYKGERIPKLSEVINYAKDKIKLNIELKTNGHEKKLAERAVKIVHDMDFSQECILTSFDYNQIKKVKEIDPDLKVGFIFSKYPDEFDVFAAPIEILSVHHSVVDLEFMKKANLAGKEIHVWTVNDEDQMKKLIDLQVSSIITNYPDKLHRILND